MVNLRPLRPVPVKILISLVFYLTLCVIGVGIFACSDIGVGKGGVSADLAPGGTLVSQGQFTAGMVPGKTVTGVISIYMLPTTENILRLESFSAPAESGLQLIVKASGNTVFTSPLKAYTGNQNYNTGLSGQVTWTSVAIAPASQPNSVYGLAVMQNNNPAPTGAY